MKIKNIAKRILNSHKDSTLNCGFMINPYIFGGAIGGWKELGRTTLGSVSDTITVSSLASKRYYMILTDLSASGSIYPQLRINNDSGFNYGSRRSANGGDDTTLTGRAFIFEGGAASTSSNFNITYLTNYTTKEKLAIRHTVFQGTAGVSNAPAREEIAGKWADTTNSINRFDEINTTSGDYDSGSEMVVLGWDPADTHTTNFWTELGSGTASGSSQTLDVSITAKKYIWFQAYMQSGSSADIGLQLGSSSLDTSSNYARRTSLNGGADSTGTSASYINIGNFASTEKIFVNGFIVNVSSKEKLIIMHMVDHNATGAGNAPARSEIVGKWVNTTNQFNHIGLYESTGNLNSITTMKVWGSD